MAKYLFPGAVYKKLAHTAFYFNTARPELELGLGLNVPAKLKEMHQLYRLSTRQYLGLGALLQFIPRSQSYKIREQFSELLYSSMQDNFLNNQAFQSQFSPLLKRASKSMRFILNFGPIDAFLLEVVHGFYKEPVVKNNKETIKNIAASSILFGFFVFDPKSATLERDKHPWKTALTSVLNPFSLLRNIILFTELMLYKLIDLGSKGETSSTPRVILKGFIGRVSWVLRIPTMAASAIMAVLPFLVINLIVDPLVHVLKSVKEAIFTYNKRIVVATAQDFRKLRKREVKNRYSKEDKYFTTFGKTHKSEFIGVNREKLYSGEYNNDQWVAKRVPAKKLAKTHELLNKVGKFREIPRDHKPRQKENESNPSP